MEHTSNKLNNEIEVEYGMIFTDYKTLFVGSIGSSDSPYIHAKKEVFDGLEAEMFIRYENFNIKNGEVPFNLAIEIERWQFERDYINKKKKEIQTKETALEILKMEEQMRVEDEDWVPIKINTDTQYLYKINGIPYHMLFGSAEEGILIRFKNKREEF